MNAESSNEAHVILNMDDAWYKVPVDVVQGYQVDPATLTEAAEASGGDANDGTVSGFALRADLFSSNQSFRQGTAFFPGGAAGIGSGFGKGGPVDIEVVGDYHTGGPTEIGRDGGYAR